MTLWLSNWTWPDLPTLAFPEIPASFSTSFKTAFDTVTGIVKSAWGTLKAIFDKISGAAGKLAETIGTVVGGAVDAATAAFDALKGARGIDRIYAEINEIANTSAAINPFGSDFEKGYALTEALQAGQIGLDSYRLELSKVATAGGEFAATAQQMIDASRSLDSFKLPEPVAPPNVALPDTAKLAAVHAEIASVQKSANALPPLVQGVVNKVSAILSGVNFAPQGARMMDTLAAGIRARAVRDHLPSSPAKIGPLSDLHRLRFTETIAASIRPEPMVKAMRFATAAALAAAVPLAADINPALATPTVHSQVIPPVLEATRHIAGAATHNELPWQITPQHIAPQAVIPTPPLVSRSEREEPANDVRLQPREPAPGGSTVKINYQPTIHLSGDAQSAENKFREMLEEHRRDIKRMMDEENRRETRRRH